MVEKIIVNPNEIRGYGNIHEATSVSDWSIQGSTLTKTTDTVDGATTDVFQLSPNTYTLSFNSASYTTNDGTLTLTVSVLDGVTPVSGATVTVTGGGGSGTGTTSNLGNASITVTGITESGTLTATYETSHATATVTYQSTTYSLTFSNSSYQADLFNGTTVSCTLTDDGTPLSGETVTFSWDDIISGPQSVTATTNNIGVATHHFGYWDITGYPISITATYSTASATCTIIDAIE